MFPPTTNPHPIFATEETTLPGSVLQGYPLRLWAPLSIGSLRGSSGHSLRFRPVPPSSGKLFLPDDKWCPEFPPQVLGPVLLHPPLMREALLFSLAPSLVVL